MTEALREKAKELATRPYTIRILRDDSVEGEPLYLALNPELDGCMAQGETIEQAEEYLAEFRIDYIEHLLENNLPVPYPASMATITGVPVSGDVTNLKIESKNQGFEDILDQAIRPREPEILFEGSLKTLKTSG